MLINGIVGGGGGATITEEVEGVEGVAPDEDAVETAEGDADEDVVCVP